ncbi:MAG: hypothetical protein MUO76_14520, partial [Anaerolineaceae bacterium]|nr:hypothetical protein [Anaerolineaceae bacterium]
SAYGKPKLSYSRLTHIPPQEKNENSACFLQNLPYYFSMVIIEDISKNTINVSPSRLIIIHVIGIWSRLFFWFS